MKKGLIMEGGAMRGMFTAGVNDVFLENNIVFVTYTTKNEINDLNYNIQMDSLFPYPSQDQNIKNYQSK